MTPNSANNWVEMQIHSNVRIYSQNMS